MTGTLPQKGSFRGKSGVAFTGTWNCNGVVYHTP